LCLKGLKKNAKIPTSGGGSLCPDRDEKRAPSEYIACLESAANYNCVTWLVQGGRLLGTRLRQGAALQSRRTQL